MGLVKSKILTIFYDSPDQAVIVVHVMLLNRGHDNFEPLDLRNNLFAFIWHSIELAVKEQP